MLHPLYRGNKSLDMSNFRAINRKIPNRRGRARMPKCLDQVTGSKDPRTPAKEPWLGSPREPILYPGRRQGQDQVQEIER
jgi:hypothetical protein